MHTLTVRKYLCNLNKNIIDFDFHLFVWYVTKERLKEPERDEETTMESV